MSSSSSVRSKRLLLGVLLVLLVFPAVQTWLNIKLLRPSLSGYEAPVPRPALHPDSLLAGTYQPALERYASAHLGLREQLIRPHNQVLYSLFGRSPNVHIVRGQAGMLFGVSTIAHSLGQDAPVRPAELQPRVQQLRALQDTLARRGKLLVLAIAPSKAALYPELLPIDLPRSGWQDSSNYQRIVPRLTAAGLNVLDLAALFRRWKPTAPYPLFTRGGTHWSGYGVVRAADTLFSYLARRGRLPLRRFRVVGQELSTTPRYTDDDIARALNLLWNPPAGTLCYPQVQFGPEPAGQHRPRLLLVGDSFGWSFIEFYPFVQELFAPESHFWYYNQEVQWTGTTLDHHVPAEQYQVSSLDHRAQLAAHDVVLLLVNEANITALDFGFSADMLRTLAGS